MALIGAGAPDFEGGANRVDSYQHGVILNVNGERFLDEAEDARHTLRRIFEEDEHRAHVVVDSTVQKEYVRATGPSMPVSAPDVETLFEDIDIDTENALETIRAYNTACSPDVFDLHTVDGNSVNLSPPKSDWAIPINDYPYYVYEVTSGITFTFGGVDISSDAQVLDGHERAIPGGVHGRVQYRGG